MEAADLCSERLDCQFASDSSRYHPDEAYCKENVFHDPVKKENLGKSCPLVEKIWKGRQQMSEIWIDRMKTGRKDGPSQE